MTATVVSLHPRPTIDVVAGKRHVAADQAISALVQARAPLYQRGFGLVTVAEVTAKNADGEPFQVPGIVNLTGPMLARALAQVANWTRFDARAKFRPP